ncbi:MAG TPA: biosynthetic arginine decarboxylase [Thermoleophilia bacterium]|nr:biosynthetic arginine decarboxylase [Thermoleophilia bacterium]
MTDACAWTKEDADSVYHISRWGVGYFDINDKGHLCVLPERTPDGPRIDIADVLDEIKAQGLEFPVVVRFGDILRSAVRSLNETFREIIEEAEYQGRYIGVYPIKVNQMREVIEEILDAGAPYDYGVEAGSKPELLAALAMNDSLETLTVVNGFKDEDYLRLALLGRTLGRKVIVVVEQTSELRTLLRLAREMDVDPLIGVRAKMSAEGSGKWCESGGEKAKFGLTIAEILQVVATLRDEGRLDCLKLFHFHIGSQVTDIKTIKEAVREGARIYAKIAQLGAPLEYFDVGGGLGVDYDGSQSTTNSSVNYKVRDYAADIVYITKEICDAEQVAHPSIVSESGRAVTARHSCVITNVIDTIETAYTDYDTDGTNSNVMIANMREVLELLTRENVQEMYNDALDIKREGSNAFRLGILSLEQRAVIETLFWRISKEIAAMLPDMKFIPDNLYDIDEAVGLQYLCNFSVFQSAPDSWAIGQLLPVVPIRKLNVKPEAFGTIVDITCDSDGKISDFIDINETKSLLPLHALTQGEEYYIGLFLTGAYQDVIGDFHNLFGRLNEVHVFCDDDDPTNFYVEEVIKGSASESVLAAMQYNPASMAYTIKKHVDRRVAVGAINPRGGVRLVDFYEECLKAYTYLE